MRNSSFVMGPFTLGVMSSSILKTGSKIISLLWGLALWPGTQEQMQTAQKFWKSSKGKKNSVQVEFPQLRKC